MKPQISQMGSNICGICVICGSILSAFSLAAWVEPWFQTWEGSTTRQGSVMQLLMGDSRRMFANHFFDKADVYFHSGYHPSFFDEAEAEEEEAHVGEQGHEGEEHEHEYLGTPTDWLDAFGRNFYPTKHTELPDAGKGDEREILPWLKISAELDPNQIQSYVVAAYWLRERMGKTDEAEQFLRDGLRANPGSYEILFELGRVASESRNDPARARYLWTRALDQWQKSESGKEDPDWFTLRNILSDLAILEEKDGHLDLAVQYLRRAKTVGPGTSIFDNRLQMMEEKLAAGGA